MRPISFTDANVTLKGRKGIGELPAYTSGKLFITRWRASMRERLSILLFGNVWVALLSDEHPPIALAGGRSAHFELPLEEGEVGGNMDAVESVKRIATKLNKQLDELEEWVCPRCGQENTDNWPLKMDGQVVDGGCQDCWERECAKTWWERWKARLGAVTVAMDRAASAVAALPIDQWAGWIVYLLESLSSEAGGEDAYRVFLEELRADITTRLEEGRW